MSLRGNYESLSPLTTISFFLVFVVLHSTPVSLQSVDFEVGYAKAEANTVDATDRYPVTIGEINAATIKDELKNQQFEFDIKDIAPPVETDHFRLDSVGLTKVRIECVKPFDREQMVKEFGKDYPDCIEAENDVNGHRVESAVVKLLLGARIKGQGGEWTYLKINFKITDSNDEAPVFVASELTKSLDENSSPRTVNPLMRVQAEDEDTGENGLVTYTRGDVTSFGVDGKQDVKTDPGA